MTLDKQALDRYLTILDNGKFKPLNALHDSHNLTLIMPTTDTTKAMTAADVFNALDEQHMIKWEGLSDGGKRTRAIEAMELYKKEVLSSYKEELRGKITEVLKNEPLGGRLYSGLKKSLELIGK